MRPATAKETAIITFVSSNNIVAVAGISVGITKVQIGTTTRRSKVITMINPHVFHSFLVGFSLKFCCFFKKSFTIILFKF